MVLQSGKEVLCSRIHKMGMMTALGPAGGPRASLTVNVVNGDPYAPDGDLVLFLGPFSISCGLLGFVSIAIY